MAVLQLILAQEDERAREGCQGGHCRSRPLPLVRDAKEATAAREGCQGGHCRIQTLRLVQPIAGSVADQSAVRAALRGSQGLSGSGRHRAAPSSLHFFRVSRTSRFSALSIPSAPISPCLPAFTSFSDATPPCPTAAPVSWRTGSAAAGQQGAARCARATAGSLLAPVGSGGAAVVRIATSSSGRGRGRGSTRKVVAASGDGERGGEQPGRRGGRGLGARWSDRHSEGINCQEENVAVVLFLPSSNPHGLVSSGLPPPSPQHEGGATRGSVSREDLAAVVAAALAVPPPSQHRRVIEVGVWVG
ncbi:unnamed protein product [Closterium sp. Naga37s-1]|nr:unnamed protein product [Closterium sp. Naga37s-1]